jgi:hypothetical protein
MHLLKIYIDFLHMFDRLLLICDTAYPFNGM